MSLPDYAGLTRDDPNPLKRWVQRRRLDDALAALPPALQPRLIIDYGAGDGELACRLAKRFPEARVVAFEPTPQFADAARGRGCIVVEDERDLPTSADLIVCTEVFEHLPPAEEAAALDVMAQLLAPGGTLLVGVPVETGPPALIKGAFRRARRQPEASWPAVWRAFRARPGARRGEVDLAGRNYHPSHIGFDQEAFAARLSRHLGPVARRGSPLSLAPSWANAELYLLARKEPSRG